MHAPLYLLRAIKPEKGAARKRLKRGGALRR
jgi:hypothetical protein